MKNTLLTLAVLCVHVTCFAQLNEFNIHPNGLIYSDTTMQQLKHIVNRLNEKFDGCTLNKTFYGYQQAQAHYVLLEVGDITQAVKDIKGNIAFEDFVRKYYRAKVDTNLLVLKSKYSHRGAQVVKFKAANSYKTIELYNQPEYYSRALNNRWVVEYTPRSEYSKESLSAYFFITGFSTPPLPEQYGRLVQYSDCLISAEPVKKAHRPISYRRRYRKGAPAGRAFLNYVNKCTGMPVYNYKYDYTYMERKMYYDSFSRWEVTRFDYIDTVLINQPRFKRLFAAARTEAVVTGASNATLETYIARYYSKKLALKLKRSRVVVGSCSMDASPRYHAQAIALLAAETVDWDVFLRAHLDIMNDNFNRLSDGSYAWKARNTYLRELEQLDIDIIDLLLGISLIIDNPRHNHYYGSVGRIGRALADAGDKDALEKRLVATIKDDGLDSYNRLITFYLFKAYTNNLTDETRKTANLNSLPDLIKALPACVQHVIDAEK